MWGRAFQAERTAHAKAQGQGVLVSVKDPGLSEKLGDWCVALAL